MLTSRKASMPSMTHIIAAGRPRGILNVGGAVVDDDIGDLNPSVVLAQFREGLEQWKGRESKRIDAVEKDIDAVTNKLAGTIVAGSGNGRASNGAEMKALAEFARFQSAAPVHLHHFLASPQASMTVGSNPDGGYTVLPEIEKAIRVAPHDIAPMRQLASVVVGSSSEYEALIDPTLAEVKWVGERDSRDADTDAGKLYKIKITANEMAASPRATQSLLDDSFTDIAAWLTGKINVSMALKEGAAFVAGDGVMKPMGFLSYPTAPDDDFNADGSLNRPWSTLQYVPTGSATPTDAQLADAVVTMAATLRAPYRPSAKWLTGRSFYAKLRTLKDSTGRYLLSTDGRLVDQQPEQLCGFPIAPFSEDMPPEGANTLPLALGDWSSYAIYDRVGIKILRDPFTAKPYIVFYTTKRVGGGVVNFHGIKLLKIAAS